MHKAGVRKQHPTEREPAVGWPTERKVSMRRFRVALLGLCALALLITVVKMASTPSAATPLAPNAHAVYIAHTPASPEPNPMRSYGAVVTDIANWVNAYEDDQAAAAFATAEANQAAQEAAARAAQAPAPTPTAVPSSCGYPSVPGALQGCMWQCIEMAESTDTPTDHSGLYGDLDSTWAGYGGYPYAGAAPLSVQNDFNQNLYNRDGWRPWNDHCTGT